MTRTSLPRRRFLRAVAGSALGAAVARPLAAAGRRLDAATARVAGRGASPGWRAALREEYLLSPDILYVNHASIGTMPRVVHEARIELLRRCEENPWLYMWGGAWEAAREDARAELSAYLGADPGRVAVTHNTTEGFNLLANGLGLGTGDEVLFTSLNHDGASVTWDHNATRRGFSVRREEFPILDAPGMTSEDVTRWHLEVLRPDTRVLVLPHVDNMVGIRHDVAAITRGARSAGVEFVAVDGAQSAGMFPLALDEMGMDLYAGSPHKWLQSAKGLGFAYLSPAVRRVLEPMWVTWGQARWDDSARRFEDYGTRNLAEVVNLADAVTFQAGLWPSLRERGYREIRDGLRDRVQASPRLTWRSPERWSDGASLVAVGVRGRRAPEVASRLLREHGVVLRAFGGPLNAVRISPHLMTTEPELDHLVRLLEEAAA